MILCRYSRKTIALTHTIVYKFNQTTSRVTLHSRSKHWKLSSAYIEYIPQMIKKNNYNINMSHIIILFRKLRQTSLAFLRQHHSRRRRHFKEVFLIFLYPLNIPSVQYVLFSSFIGFLDHIDANALQSVLNKGQKSCE